jgi:solute carrier family 35 (UDP-sugar transporter), member A1/2/3
MARSKFGFVVAYVLADVIRSLCAEAMYALAPDRKPLISITLVVLLVELSKFFAAFVIVFFTSGNFGLHDLRHFVVPAILYFANSCLYYWILTGASVSGLSLLMHVRLPLTALVHHFLVKKQESLRAWISLAFVFVGVSLAQFSEHFAFTDARVLLVTLIICVNSSVASVVNERTLKTISMPFWDQQLRMYFFGVVSSVVAVHASIAQGKEMISVGINFEPIARNSAVAHLLSLVGCVASGAAAGILTGFIIYRLDNVVKVVSNSVITVVVTLASYVTFGIFPFAPLNFFFGTLILAIASFAYALSVTKDNEGQKASFERKEMPALWKPTKFRARIQAMP